MVLPLSSVSSTERAGALQHLTPFKGVGAGQLLQALDLGMTPVDVEKGEILVREGEVDPSLMVVVSGAVDVFLGAPPVRLARVGQGELLGEMAVFGRDHRRSATLRTASDCQLLLLDGGDLVALRAAGNGVVAALEAAALRSLGARLMATRERLTVLESGAPREALLQGERAWLQSLRSALARSDTPSEKPQLIEVLADTGLLRGVKPEWLEALSPLFTARRVRRGELLFRERDRSPGAWLIADASVSLIREKSPGRIVELERVEGGQLLGLETLIGAKGRSASAVVAEPGWVFSLDPVRYAQLEARRTPPAAVLRRAVYDGLCDQLERVNARVVEAARSAQGSE